MQKTLGSMFALGMAAALALTAPGHAADRRKVTEPAATDRLECQIAAVAIARKLDERIFSGMTLTYAADLPDDSYVTEGSWTSRMSVPTLRDFDRQAPVSAIPLCPGLTAALNARGARLVEGQAFTEQSALLKRDRTTVLKVTLPMLGVDGDRAWSGSRRAAAGAAAAAIPISSSETGISGGSTPCARNGRAAVIRRSRQADQL